MTQSGQSKKPQPAVEEVKAVEAPAPKKKEAPKSKMEILIERLREEKPQIYEQYVQAAKNRRPVWIYPDLTVRIG
jgi:hypothetical protein